MPRVLRKSTTVEDIPSGPFLFPSSKSPKGQEGE